MKLWEVKSEIWALLGETSNSTTFSTDRLTNKIDDVIKRVCRGYVPSKLQLRVIYRVQKLQFMEGRYTFRTIQDTVLTADYSVGDATIYADTTDYPSTGKLLIWPEIITYTGKTSTTFTGVSGGSIKYLSGEVVVPLYVLPTDCDRPNEVNYISGGESEIPLDIWINHYEISDNTLKIVWFSSSQVIQTKYTKKVTKVTDDNQNIIVPDPYGSVIAQLVAGEFANEYTLPNLQNLLSDAYTSLQEMYAYYSNPTGEVITRIQPKSYNFRSINGN